MIVGKRAKLIYAIYNRIHFLHVFVKTTSYMVAYLLLHLHYYIFMGIKFTIGGVNTCHSKDSRNVAKVSSHFARWIETPHSVVCQKVLVINLQICLNSLKMYRKQLSV